MRNVRIHADEATGVIDRLPDGSLGRVFILFPDPWPKRRHGDRRIVRGPVLDRLARVMRAGAELRIATDHPAYLNEILRRTLAHPAFRWTAARADDWRCRPPDWPGTRYEAKARAEGRPPTYLSFVRRDG